MITAKVEVDWIHRDLDVLLECMQSSLKVGVLKILMPNVSHPTAWFWPSQELISFPWVPGLGSDVHWNLLCMRSNVNHIWSGVWLCVSHFGGLPVYLSVCVLVTPQAIKRMMLWTRALCIYWSEMVFTLRWPTAQRRRQQTSAERIICGPTIAVVLFACSLVA